MAPWAIAGAALVAALVAILLPGGGTVSPDAASFDGLAQVYHDGQAPDGAWDVTGAYVSQRWLLHQDPQADFAFLTVRPKDIGGTERTMQSVVGGDPLVIGRPPPQWTVVVGYPAGTGGQPVICLNQTVARRGYPGCCRR